MSIKICMSGLIVAAVAVFLSSSPVSAQATNAREKGFHKRSTYNGKLPYSDGGAGNVRRKSHKKYEEQDESEDGSDVTGGKIRGGKKHRGGMIDEGGPDGDKQSGGGRKKDGKRKTKEGKWTTEGEVTSPK